MRTKLRWLALAVVTIATPVSAQTLPATRAEEAQRAREERAAQAPRDTTGKIEHFLNWFERNPMLSGQAINGFGVRVGIKDGSGLALGPSWQTSNALNGALKIGAAGAMSIAGDREVAGSVALPRLAGGRVALALDVAATHLAQERYYGAGMTSVTSNAAAFSLERRSSIATGTFNAARWLQISAGAGTLNARTADAGAPGVAPISLQFTPEDTAGIGIDHVFTVTSMSAVADVRDIPGNPRKGGRYAITARRYAAAPQQPYSFTQVDGEVEQHVPFWKRQRLITLRAIASTALTAEGQAVPFYLQPTLGGSRVLRGFMTDRFRDRSLVALQAEYGWDLSPFLNAVMFYEAGAVGSTLSDISSQDFRRDYGIGLRFGAVRTVAFRTDVAFGSGEGVRVTMRFNHAF